MNEEFYNHHYITTRPDGVITDAWSDGPHMDKNPAGAVCINEKGGYQLRLTIQGKQTGENPPIHTEDGVPLYRWDGEQVVERTAEEIEAERAAVPEPPPTAQEQLRADVDFLLCMGGLL